MFDIIADGKVIGRTKFEFGDPPMGVAFGKFDPVEEFAEFASTAPLSKPYTEQLRVWSNLTAVSADGVALTGACVTVMLMEPESIWETAEYEVSAEGIPYPLYEALFAHHIAEYEARF